MRSAPTRCQILFSGGKECSGAVSKLTRAALVENTYSNLLVDSTCLATTPTHPKFAAVRRAGEIDRQAMFYLNL